MLSSTQVNTYGTSGLMLKTVWNNPATHQLSGRSPPMWGFIRLPSILSDLSILAILSDLIHYIYIYILSSILSILANLSILSYLYLYLSILSNLPIRSYLPYPSY